MQRLGSALGNVALGDRFWDREVETAELVRYATEGTSTLLVGPRRIGKTSIVRRVLEELGEGTAATVFADVQDADTAEEFFAEIAASASRDAGMLERLRGHFRRTFDRLQSFEVATLKIELAAEFAGTWRSRGRELLDVLSAEGPVVLAVDELPLLVHRLVRRNHDDAEELLNVLRKSVDSSARLRLMVSGSIGLEPVLHRAGLTGHITFLRRYDVGPWDEPTTTSAVRALAAANDLRLDEEAARVVHARLGAGVPYHVQLFSDAIRHDASRRGATTVTARDVSRIYEERLLPSVSAHMLHLESRLRSALGEGAELRLAYDLLTEASVSGVLTTRTAMLLADDILEHEEQRVPVLREVLEILEHDAYLRATRGEYRFTSRLVRDWWRDRNGFGFVPAEKRGTGS